MKLWHVSVDDWEYDSFVVRAENAEHARRVVVDNKFPETIGGEPYIFRDADEKNGSERS